MLGADRVRARSVPRFDRELEDAALGRRAREHPARRGQAEPARQRPRGHPERRRWCARRRERIRVSRAHGRGSGRTIGREHRRARLGIADYGDDCARPGVAWVRFVAGIGLHYRDFGGVAVDRWARTTNRAGNDDCHVRRQRPCRRRHAISRTGRPVSPAPRIGGIVFKALEARRSRSAAEAVLLPPLGTPERDISANGGVAVANHERAAR